MANPVYHLIVSAERLNLPTILPYSVWLSLGPRKTIHCTVICGSACGFGGRGPEHTCCCRLDMEWRSLERVHTQLCGAGIVLLQGADFGHPQMQLSWSGHVKLSRWRRGWPPRYCALKYCCHFFLICPVSCDSSLIAYSREELVKFSESATYCSPPFMDSFTAVRAAAAAPTGQRERRRRGKRAAVLVKIRWRGFRLALPSIYSANARPLPNKMDELLLLNETRGDFSRSAALWFTETWLGEHILDNSPQLPGFQLFHADRVAGLSGKGRGGGIGLYINESWCTEVVMLGKSCSPHLEIFPIHRRPVYSPREFSPFILIGVYIPPQACVREALQHLSDQITEVEHKHPDSLLIVLGYFNSANLGYELPKFKQLIKCPTRGANILDHWYTAIKDAYCSVTGQPWDSPITAWFTFSPAYRQKGRLVKPVVRTVGK